ncbi:MAG: ParB/RepB/Spo0J family partition protein [Ignavibacteria bacterium]
MEKTGGLGKGLSALFEQNNALNETSHESKQSIVEIEIEKIVPNPYQPRKDFPEESLQELADSIKQNGLLQPIAVTYSEDKTFFYIISGERRIRASMLAGLKTVPAYIYDIKEYSQEQFLELAVIENIQRDNLNPMDLSDAFYRLMSECNLTQEQIAQKVAKQRSTIANYIRLQKLPPEIKNSLRKNEISEAHARTLLRVEDTTQQFELWKKLLQENISVRQLEDLTRKPRQKHRKKPNLSQVLVSNDFLAIEKKLQLFFGTKVYIKPKSRSSGDIVIEFYSFDDLDRIIEKCEIT